MEVLQMQITKRKKNQSEMATQFVMLTMWLSEKGTIMETVKRLVVGSSWGEKGGRNK